MQDWKKIEALARRYGTRHKTDLLIYNGPINAWSAHKFMHLCRQRKRRPNVMLILVTSGGDAHAAYRMGRSLQLNYQNVTVFVPGWCKSAGTLLAIAGHRLIMGDFGELGPIDVQQPKSDDLWESSSGLTEDAAIESLEGAAWKMFRAFVFEIKQMSGGKITFKTAADAASSMVVGAFTPIFGQIDPLKIGENSRAIKIASDYGLRLGARSKNLLRNREEESMESLVSGYSSHGFVIDRDEANILFQMVYEPDKDLEHLCELLGHGAYVPLNETETLWSRFLNPEVVSRRSTKSAKKGKGDETSKPGRSAKAKRRVGADAKSDTAAAIGKTAAGAGSNVAELKRP